MSEFVTFLTGDYVVLQDDNGYLFSADSVLLANLAKIGREDSVIDLGTGCGVLAILTAVKKGAKRIVGIEIDEATADMARRSVKRNSLEDTISIVTGDVKDIKNLVVAGEFDKAICNPPYFSADDGFGTDGVKATARKQGENTIEHFVKASAYALKNGGDLFVVYKADRLVELVTALHQNGLEPKHITYVYPKLSKGVDTVIISARKGGKIGLKSSTLILMDEEGRYLDKVKELYN
ncbi:MAG: methyltransferase [Clostridia bacterium]|nr:methyltransferase [Clostridia bacterium]